MANSVDPDQTASIGAVCSGSKLFASILNSSVISGNYLQQTTSAGDFSRQHFQMHFFLDALWVKHNKNNHTSMIFSQEPLAGCGVVYKHLPCKPVVAGSGPGFTSLLDETLSCDPISI